jgi:glycosyltransferase involved in cell wall biosynthesis
MKMILIGPVKPYRGGIAHYTDQLSEALNDANIQHTIISFKKLYPLWLYPGKSDKEPDIENKNTSAKYLLDPINPITWWKTARNIKAQEPDLVVFQWWTTFTGPAYTILSWLIKQKKIKVAFIIHNVLPHEEGLFDIFLTKLALNSSNFFIVQTPKEKKRLQDLFPDAVIEECAHPIYNFSSQKTPSTHEARVKMGLDTDEIVFLFFGFVRPYKGLKYLIDAMGMIKEKGYHPKLIIAGEFWENIDIYHQLIREKNIAEQVIIHDYYIPNEEIELFFTAADCLIAPYTSATQSGSASIALGFGLPMIVTSIVSEGIRRENRVKIRVAKPENAPSLAEAMVEFIDNNFEEGQKRIPSKNDWHYLVETLIKF